MNLLGKSIDSKNINEILSCSEVFLDSLFQNTKDAIYLDDNYNLSNNIPEVDYYLIYNRFIAIGKKKIDKRVVRQINRSEIINELNENWVPGDEPNFILLPKKFELAFGLYIQDSIFYYETMLC